MATRNTAARLVEGRTYSAPVPREELRVWRAPLPKFVGREYQQTSVVTAGALVPVGGPTLVPRQKIKVGQLVRLEVGRASRVRGAALQAIGPAVIAGLPTHYYGGSMNLVMDKYRDDTFPWVVLATDGKYMKVRKLTASTSWALRAIPASGDTAAYMVNSRYGQENTPMTPRQVLANIRGSEPQPRLARVSHITAIYEPSYFPGALYEAMRLKIRSQVADVLFERLAQSYPPQRTVRSGGESPHGRRLRKERGRDVARYLADAREYWDSDSATALGCLKEAAKVIAIGIRLLTHGDMHHSLTHPGTAAERVSQAVSRWARNSGFGTLHVAAGCGHYHDGVEVLLTTDRFGSQASMCPACAASAVEIVADNGTTAMATAATAANMNRWSDGTVRFTREPGVIGGRHSGKGIVGFVSPLGYAPDGYRTLGLELEMQAYNGSNREEMAREMKNRLRDANVLDVRAQKKYLHFEEDGSTGVGGFEMVTGYSDLDTHATLLAAVLTDSTGAPAFSGKLRSHDADGQSCGIHVHIAKPKRLIHAMKMRYFINAAHTMSLVKAIARRYSSGGYAKVQNRLVPTPAESEKQTAKVFKDSKRYGQSNRLTATSAIGRINANDRYEALNFQNAATVEFRIFRGSMIYGTVMACMEFTLATYDFCLVTSTVNLTDKNFVEFINRPENRKQTVNLRQYLKRKGFETFVPKPVKAAPFVPSVESVEDAAAREPMVWTLQPPGTPAHELNEAPNPARPFVGQTETN